MNVKQYIHHVRSSVTKLPAKKQYIELVTATLSVPVLATAIVLNLNNLRPKDTTTTPSPVQEKIIYISPKESPLGIKSDTSTSECKKGIAPLSITSPEEGETLSENPVSIIINYSQGEYCSAVWAYRINNGKWSEYDDKSIALYNLPTGIVRFDLRVKSLADSTERTYSRTFTYTGTSGQVTPSLSPDSSSSGSASL